MDRCEKVTLKRNDNRCGRAKISVPATNGGILSHNGYKRCERDLHIHIKKIQTHIRETELKEEE
jgi:hypothetical protein